MTTSIQPLLSTDLTMRRAGLLDRVATCMFM
jgi:hypothetical protein